MVEQSAVNREVVGSSPILPALEQKETGTPLVHNKYHRIKAGGFMVDYYYPI